MSQENVETVRQAFDSLTRGGVEGLLPFLDPQIRWISIPEFLPDARDHYGHEGVVRWFEMMSEVLKEPRWSGDHRWPADRGRIPDFRSRQEQRHAGADLCLSRHHDGKRQGDPLRVLFDARRGT